MKKMLIAKKACVVYCLIAIAFVGMYIYSSNRYVKNDYKVYIKYKKYEEKVEKKVDIINKEINKNVALYYKNNINKLEIIKYLKKEERILQNLYSSFKWNDGDTLTKEMFLIKKQIILNYVKMYEKEYKCLEDGIKYTSKEESNYIKYLKEQYYEKDKLEREKYNISFDKK